MYILHLVGLSMVIRKMKIFVSNFSSPWLSHVRSVFTNEEKTRLDLFNTSDTHAGLVYDVTDIDY